MSTDPAAEQDRDPIAELLRALAGPLGQLISKLNLEQLSEMRSGAAELFRTLAQIQQTLAQLERTASQLNDQLAAIGNLLPQPDDSTNS
jgi:ABC-type transporter Mla subunit MlaD